MLELHRSSWSEIFTHLFFNQSRTCQIFAGCEFENQVSDCEIVPVLYPVGF